MGGYLSKFFGRGSASPSVQRTAKALPAPSHPEEGAPLSCLFLVQTRARDSSEFVAYARKLACVRDIGIVLGDIDVVVRAESPERDVLLKAFWELRQFNIEEYTPEDVLHRVVRVRGVEWVDLESRAARSLDETPGHNGEIVAYVFIQTEPAGSGPGTEEPSHRSKRIESVMNEIVSVTGLKFLFIAPVLQEPGQFFAKIRAPDKIDFDAGIKTLKQTSKIMWTKTHIVIG